MKHASRIVLVACIVMLGGCAAEDVAQLQGVRNQAAALLAQAQAAQAQVQGQLTTRPADDPIRQQVDPLLQRLATVIDKAQSALPVLDAAIKSTSTGSTIDAPVQQAVAALPYGSLALAAIGLVFGAVKHVQAGSLAGKQQQLRKSFEQVVAALDAVLPAPTPEQQAKVNAVLDTDVKARVAAVRA